MTLQNDLILLAQAKEELKAQTDEVAVLEARVIAGMHSAKQSSVSVSGIKGTLVEAERVIIHEDQLQSALGATWWKKVTKPVLDKEKLEAFVATGQIDASVVAQASELKPNKPYVRITGNLEVPEPKVNVKGAAAKRGKK